MSVFVSFAEFDSKATLVQVSQAEFNPASSDVRVSWGEFNPASSDVRVSWGEFNPASSDVRVSWAEFNPAAEVVTPQLPLPAGGLFKPHLAAKAPPLRARGYALVPFVKPQAGDGRHGAIVPYPMRAVGSGRAAPFQARGGAAAPRVRATGTGRVGLPPVAGAAAVPLLRAVGIGQVTGHASGGATAGVTTAWGVGWVVPVRPRAIQNLPEDVLAAVI